MKALGKKGEIPANMLVACQRKMLMDTKVLPISVIGLRHDIALSILGKCIQIFHSTSWSFFSNPHLFRVSYSSCSYNGVVFGIERECDLWSVVISVCIFFFFTFLYLV